MKARRIIREFLQAASKEGRETAEAVRLIRKQANGERLTEEESIAVREQIVDALKMAGVMVPFALIPGSSLLLPLMVSVSRKYGFEILPSAFSETIIYVGTREEIETGDIAEYDGSRWIVTGMTDDTVTLEGCGEVDRSKARKVVPFLATRNVEPGEPSVDEHSPDEPSPHVLGTGRKII